MRSITGDHALVSHQLSEHLAEISQIVFFLLGAMTIVELVDAHQGFKIITDNINTRSKSTLMWLIGSVTFCMSAVLDNLTATCALLLLLHAAVPRRKMRSCEATAPRSAMLLLFARALALEGTGATLPSCSGGRAL